MKLDLVQVELCSKLSPLKPLTEQSNIEAANNGMKYDITISNGYSCAYNSLVENWVDEVQMVNDFNATVDLSVTPSGWEETDIQEFAKRLLC